jgi:CDP-diacylglycerol--glycerol-3-phosphate 3-phosphatidyltransferase
MMNTANLLSFSRLLLAPLIPFYFARKNLYGVLIIWFLAALTDFLDGRVARKLGEISELGKILDPVADKVTLACSFIPLMIWYELPRWLGVIYITKEIFQLAGGLFFLKKKQKLIPSNYWGKASTFIFFIGLFLYCFYSEMGVTVLSIGLILSLIALFTYTRNILKKD